MRLRTTSTQRTYRYVRLSIIGAAVALLVATGAEIVRAGPLGSLSAAIHTPAAGVFVGALCAVALALLALSGHSVEQALLDVAAIFAVLVAIVPVPVDGVVPASMVPAVDVAMTTLVIVGALAIVGMAILLGTARTLDRSTVPTLVASAALIVGAAVWWTVAPGSFLALGHGIATIGFFGLVAVVAALAAWRPAGPQPWLRVAYAIAAIGIAVGILLAVVVAVLPFLGIDMDGRTRLPLFFIAEVGVVVFFAGFWAVQTVELWDEVDPRMLRA